MIDLTPKEVVVLQALEGEPLTADEFVTTRGWYVNSWAPVFAGLRKRGLVARTGDQRTTTHGAPAFVVAITDAGKLALLGEAA